MSVDSNGDCTLQALLAAKHHASRLSEVHPGQVAKLRKLAKASQSGFISFGQADAVLKVLDLGVVLVRDVAGGDGLQYWVRRPEAASFTLIRETSCAGGVHWAPIKCRDGAQRCGVMTMQLARAFLHDHGVVERDNLDESRMEASGTIVID